MVTRNPRAVPAGVGRTLLFSVTLSDCEVQHFRAGGSGGQNQNKRDSGTRIIHHPSGARGESREERSQLQNTKTAFRRMAASPLFQWWLKQESLRIRGEETAAEWVAAELANPAHVRVEGRTAQGDWVEIS